MRLEKYMKKNGSAAWMAKGYLGTNPKTGQSKTTTLRGFDTKMEAKSAFEEAIYNFKNGINAEKIGSKKKFRDVYAEWWQMYTQTVEASTSRKTRQVFADHILPQFGNYWIDQVQIMDAERWAIKLSKQLAMYVKVVGYASQLMKYSVRVGYIDRNPFDYIEKPRTHKQARKLIKQNYYSFEELSQFIDSLNKMAAADTSPTRDWVMARAFLILTATTGMRRGETIALKWSDINFQDGKLTIQRAEKRGDQGLYVGTTKTANSMRTVYLDPLAIDVLQDWRKGQVEWLRKRGLPTTHWIFSNAWQPDQIMSENNPYRWMRALSEATGIRRITTHGLRHTKGTLLSEAGARPADIAAILGHSSGAFSLKHYVHPTDDGVIQAEALFNERLRESEKK